MDPLGLGIAFCGGSVYWLMLTIWSARSEEDVRKSEERESAQRLQAGPFGFMTGRTSAVEWAHRATYRHPILMRGVGILGLSIGVVLIVAG